MSMGLCTWQIGTGRIQVNAPWRWVKNQQARKARRLARRLGEEAPRKRRYHGWVA